MFDSENLLLLVLFNSTFLKGAIVESFCPARRDGPGVGLDRADGFKNGLVLTLKEKTTLK